MTDTSTPAERVRFISPGVRPGAASDSLPAVFASVPRYSASCVTNPECQRQAPFNCAAGNPFTENRAVIVPHARPGFHCIRCGEPAALTSLCSTSEGGLADAVVEPLKQMGADKGLAHYFAGEVTRLILH